MPSSRTNFIADLVKNEDFLFFISYNYFRFYVIILEVFFVESLI